MRVISQQLKREIKANLSLNNTIRPGHVAIASTGIGRTAPATRPPDRLALDEDTALGSGEALVTRLELLEGSGGVAAHEQRRRPPPRENTRFFTDNPKPMIRSMPGPLLDALILQMGGAGAYAGTGQVVNIAV